MFLTCRNGVKNPVLTNPSIGCNTSSIDTNWHTIICTPTDSSADVFASKTTEKNTYTEQSRTKLTEIIAHKDYFIMADISAIIKKFGNRNRAISFNVGYIHTFCFFLTYVNYKNIQTIGKNSGD